MLQSCFSSGIIYDRHGQVISALHHRFSTTFTPALLSAISLAISAPNRAALAALAPEQREKEDTVRVTRQRPVLRVCSELALVGIIKDGPGRSGGEWMMKVLKELASLIWPTFWKFIDLMSAQLSNDPSLSSLPLLTTFLKSYSRPYLGITPPASSKQVPLESEVTTNTATSEAYPALSKEADELVEQDIRDRFKRMCEGYYDNVCKKLVIEHKVRFLRIAPSKPVVYLAAATPRTR